MKEQTAEFRPVIWIHIIAALLIASSLSINPLKISRAFFSDEAVYYCMAYSFAFDGDMVYQRKDLLRVYKEFEKGPQGIILKLNERDGTIVYGKNFLYSLLAAPFVRVFRTNGFLTFNSLLLWLNLLCGYRVCRIFMSEQKALFFTFFYFLANATIVYLFWMTPEYLNLSLICYAFFFFLAAEFFQSKNKLFTSPYNYMLAALFFGLATYSKPTNALLIVPLGIWMLWTKRIVPALITLTVFVVVTLGLFGMNMYFTGDWLYQRGNRVSLLNHFPYERPGSSEFAPFGADRQIEAMVKPPFYLKTFLNNWVYFFFGRFSGLAIYFFPMFFALVFFFVGKKNSLSTAIYIAGWVGIFTYMVGIPWNYFGGSGTIGNRYLLSVFPVFLFALRKEPSTKVLVASLAISLLFSARFLLTPVYSSVNVDFHQKQSVFTQLPVEKSLLTDLPSCCGTQERRVAFEHPSNYFVYFIDDNTFFAENNEGRSGFWVKGEKTCEFVLRVFSPTTRTMTLHLKSLSPNNKVEITVDGNTRTVLLKDSQFYEVEIPLGSAFLYDRDGRGPTSLFDVKIHSQSGAIAKLNWPGDRYLGVFVRIDVPQELGKPGGTEEKMLELEEQQ